MIKSLIAPWMTEWCSEVWTSSIAWELGQQHGAITVAGVLKHDQIIYKQVKHLKQNCNFTFIMLRNCQSNINHTQKQLVAASAQTDRLKLYSFILQS